MKHSGGPYLHQQALMDAVKRLYMLGNRAYHPEEVRLGDDIADSLGSIKGTYEDHKRREDAVKQLRTVEKHAGDTSGVGRSLRGGASDYAVLANDGLEGYENHIARREVSKGDRLPSGPYNTNLSSRTERKYQDWKNQTAPDDSGEDYDYRGAYLAGEHPGEDGHMTDHFKKPNHPTFSDESQYGQFGNPGHWDGDVYTPAIKAQEKNEMAAHARIGGHYTLQGLKQTQKDADDQGHDIVYGKQLYGLGGSIPSQHITNPPPDYMQNYKINGGF